MTDLDERVSGTAPLIGRRTLLRLTAQLTLLAPFARVAHSAEKPDARFVLVILRGGLDGLAAVPPYGEPRYRALRGSLALDAPGGETGALPLDGLFGLHPSLVNLHEMYRANELAVLHAVATPYRDRSHFDAQKVLEAGGIAPSAADGGWLNRALGGLAKSGAKREAIALAESLPLVLRGDFAASTWSPSHLPGADEDTLARVRMLYDAVDPHLAERLGEALAAREIAGDDAMPAAGSGKPGAGRNGKPGAGRSGKPGARGGAQAEPLTTAAARFLANPAGPRVAVIDIGGWDTHANQGAAQGNLAARLRGLDLGLAALKHELGPVWSETAVAVVTEFGRTVAVNGTRGTDHGTATCAFLAGGAVDGGRVIADWPGLAAQSLRDGRDLAATTDLRAVFKGALAEGFGMSDGALAAVFPDSESAKPISNLLRRRA
ncbi:MAG TPA: DUF1501 domain-containing protein [Gammaproteobacteria bacterium]|nr:DUF1501 domain-containing protein [Gammaproteobacteria bacterium]